MSKNRVQYTAIAAAVILLALSLPFATATFSSSVVPSCFVEDSRNEAPDRVSIRAYVPDAFRTFAVAERCGFKSDAVSLTLRLICGKDTFLLADADRNSQFSPDSGTLYGATIPKWRTPLLKFFLGIRYFPGLGKLDATGHGTRFISCGKRSSPPFASFKFHGDTLLAALSFADPDAVRDIPTTDMRDARQHARDFDGTAKVFISLPRWVGEYIGGGSRLFWKNATASALAMDSSSLLLFLPQRLPAKLLAEEASLDFDGAPGEDAVAYLNDKPYGGAIMGFALPAATIAVPGLRSSPAELATASARFISDNGLKTRTSASGATLINWTGKAMRLPERDCGLVASVSSAMVACTSSASFDAQCKSQKVDSPHWKKCRDLLPFSGETAIAFAYIDMAPIAEQLRSISGIASLLSSLNVLKLEDSAQDAVASANQFLSEYSPKGDLAMLASRQDDGRTSLTLQMTTND